VCIFGSESVSLEWRISEEDKASGTSEFLNGLLKREGSKDTQSLENRFL
jgi:hypothetical protein